MGTTFVYNDKAPKRATNLTVNSDLLTQAKRLHINLSRLLEQRLIELLQEKARQQWLDQNQDAINAYNKSVAKRGVFSDGLRKF